MDELEEKYNDIVAELKTDWKSGCIDDYKHILVGGWYVSTSKGDIFKSCGWEQPGSNEYYPEYDYISILDDNHNYETVSEIDVFEGCDTSDTDYIHYQETGEVNDSVYDYFSNEYPVYCKEFDDVVAELLEMIDSDMNIKLTGR